MLGEAYRQLGVHDVALEGQIIQNEVVANQRDDVGAFLRGEFCWLGETFSPKVVVQAVVETASVELHKDSGGFVEVAHVDLAVRERVHILLGLR